MTTPILITNDPATWPPVGKTCLLLFKHGAWHIGTPSRYALGTNKLAAWAAMPNLTPEQKKQAGII